mgnify:CR=1 FL=1
MHNEEQARKLWCPLARTEPLGAAEGFCIASQCAMWRWSNPAEPVNYLRLGYCGLAGKPNA